MQNASCGSFRRRAGAVALACSAAGLMLYASIAATPALASHAKQASASAVFTPAQVKAASNGQVTYNVFNVPKKLPSITLAFIQLDLTNPYFATWNSAMAQAASFYGVKYIYGDEQDNDANILNIFNTLELQKPNVFGAQHSTQPLLSATQSDGIPLLGLDSTAIPGLTTMGIPNTQAGEEAGNLLVPTLKKDLAGPWKGKQIYYIGLSASPCAPCDERVQGGLATLRKYVSIPKSRVEILEDGSATQTQTDVGTYLTAHPSSKDRFIIIGLNDEWAVGAMQAFVTSHRTSDAIGDTSGCDQVGLAALKNKQFKGMNVGCVNYNPFSEGWNWIEAAIATDLKQSYKPYKIVGGIKYGH
jgi:ABC-type sugar transport system substrate-binding protein